MLVNNRLSAACYRTQTLASMMAKSLALAKLLVKDGEKPDKFLRPHGMILRFDGFCIFMEDYP